jgi:AcrR family transcriptional regulator
MPKIVDRDRYRKELLQKCFDLFAQKGYGSLTMRQIAKELEVSTGTLYHYFPSKQSIFIQLIEEITDRDVVMVQDEFTGLKTIEEKINAFGEFLIKNEEYYYKQTLLFFNFFQQPELEQPELKEAIQKSYEGYQAAIMEFLEIEDKTLANQIFCTVDGLMTQRAFGFKTIGINQQMELLGKMIATYLS